MNHPLLARAVAADLLDRVVAISASCAADVDEQMQAGEDAIRDVIR